MEVTRRTALAAGAGLGAAALLGGCAPRTSAAREPIRLTYWSWLADLQIVCDRWNEQNADVQVDAVWIPPGDDGGYQRMFASIQAGGGPDLAQVEIRNVPTFVLQDGLLDLSQYGLRERIEEYDQAILNQLNFADGVWAVPQDTGPTAFYYRHDLFEEIGAEPPETWEDWLDVAREFRQVDRFLESYSVADGSFMVMLAMQAGATWFQADGDTWVINTTDDATAEAAGLFDRAIDEGLVNTAQAVYSPGWYAAVNNDQIVAATSASWGDALIQSAGATEGLWNVAPAPRFSGGYGSSQLGGSTVSVFSTTQHPYEAAEFAMWMTTDPDAIDLQIEHSGIGWSPAPGHIGTPREQPSEFFGGQRYNEEVFVPAAADQHPDWTWLPGFQQVSAMLSDLMRRKLTGRATLVDACRDLQPQVVAMLRHQGLNAREV